MRLSSALSATSIVSIVSSLPSLHERDVRDLYVTRSGTSLLLDGQPWKAAGANIYWLGLDENVTPPAGQPYYAPSKASYPTQGRITEAMAMIKALGGTAIRAHTLGVSVGNPLSVMPSQGVVNQDAFKTIDWAVFQARVYGLRLLIPLTDNYDYYHGGKVTFSRWNGNGDFYSSAQVVNSFKSYIKTLVTHVNNYTGLSYADDPTIFAYETGNELSGVPTSWLQDIASYVKQLAPKKLVVDGSYGVNSDHLRVADVDIFSNHFYGPNINTVRSDIAKGKLISRHSALAYDADRGLTVAAANKTYFAGEYDWTGRGDSLPDWYRVIEGTTGAVGSAFWSLFGHNVPDCQAFVNHNEVYTLQYGNPANSGNTNSRIQLIRQHLIKMSTGQSISASATLPAVSCPASTTGATP